MALLGSLTDDFNDNSKDGAKWAATTQPMGPLAFVSLAGSASETNQRVEVITPASADGCNGFSSFVTDFTATESQVFVKLTPPSTVAADTPGHGRLIVVHDISDANGLPHFAAFDVHLSRFGDSTIHADYNNSGSAGTQWSDTYDPANHKWLRIRFTASNIFWDTSADGLSWTQRRQISDDPGIYFDFTIAATGFFAESDNDAQSAHTWQFDNFNVSPVTGVTKAMHYKRMRA